ncbi:UDP-2,4-diacetamido-2,4,6-trideoxy-beta-L-altropyranose hydrolase [Noviherbaspirillum denitrificans]|uniref:UDP-2,4-diacetamido-2,4, 6-trideoxy-beta-L-altropyranose hydrolase n=1 Tax=Noviherbaspirillum denitrificans TaxID=1968433 RepID=A0A254TFC3_9BURK|nr:UDP-2,4-diacetamido-2,4,6-trideoxy-beta-L-altropyranose hydrolase [Noviherbaspirillum denitrificans]OWW21314.1 hypothetical protein AYR66_19365 [Noviherbaspirillum denitrificans]
MTRVAIRADAAVSIGTGHVMRCLAIANALREAGMVVEFVSRELPGNLCDLVHAEGFAVHRLPAGSGTPPGWQEDAEQMLAALSARRVDWLIVDHYGLDARWETKCRAACDRLFVIDDLADRKHDADVLLDQNYGSDIAHRYEGLIPSSCKTLLGPRFALLRPEFGRLAGCARERDGRIERIFVFFGGSDPGNETGKALEGLRALPMQVRLDVVVGSSNPHREQVKEMCAAIPGATYHCQTPSIAELMDAADLAIGAGGTATWERCCLGLPTLQVVLAENQLELTRAVAAYGAAVDLGWGNSLGAEDYRRAVESLDPAAMASMAQRARSLVDGKGALRVVQALMQTE